MLSRVMPISWTEKFHAGTFLTELLRVRKDHETEPIFIDTLISSPFPPNLPKTFMISVGINRSLKDVYSSRSRNLSLPELWPAFTPFTVCLF